MNKINLIEKIYFSSLFLFLMPSLNFRVIYSQGLGKIFLIIVFIYMIFHIIKGKISLSLNNKFIFLFCLFFIAQAISILNAIDVSSYLTQLKNLLFIAILFFCSAYIFNDKKNSTYFVFILFVVLIFNLLAEAMIFFLPNVFVEIGKVFLNQGTLNLIIYNIDRKRIYFGEYNEVMIPLALYFFIYVKKRSVSLFIPVIIIFSFLSEFRTKFLMSAFSFLASIAVLVKLGKKDNAIKAISILLFTIIVLYIVYVYAQNTIGATVINRLLIQNRVEDALTIQQRLSKLDQAINIGINSSVFGVGLGNYNYYLPSRQFVPSYPEYQQIQIGLLNPHNIFGIIFAETGSFGITVFLILLLYFTISDFKLFLSKKNSFSKTLVISFWTLFFYSLFNPTTDFNYNVLFWILRIVIFYEGTNRWTHDWIR